MYWLVHKLRYYTDGAGTTPTPILSSTMWVGNATYAWKRWFRIIISWLPCLMECVIFYQQSIIIKCLWVIVQFYCFTLLTGVSLRTAQVLKITIEIHTPNCNQVTVILTFCLLTSLSHCAFKISVIQKSVNCCRKIFKQCKSESEKITKVNEIEWNYHLLLHTIIKFC